MCLAMMTVAYNSIVDTLECKGLGKTLADKLCTIAGPWKGVCVDALTVFCAACKTVTHDHCDWNSAARSSCHKHGMC